MTFKTTSCPDLEGATGEECPEYIPHLTDLHEFSAMASGTKARIDMKHGFMKCIIQNQVDRDNYDKEVKAKQTERPKTLNKTNKPKKPDLCVYIPPTKLKDNQEELFMLEFEDQFGEVYTTPVYKNDKPGAVANKVALEKNLPSSFVSVLEDRIEEEMTKRLRSQIDEET